MTDSANNKLSTLAILAGGEGSRMGIPKAEIQLEGQPILTHLIQRIGWPGPTLLVTAPGREQPPSVECFAREAADPVSGQGPLRGVLTALEHSDTVLVIVATVDMPAITSVQLTYLGEMLRQHEECDPNASSGKFAVYSSITFTPKAGGKQQTHDEVGLYTVKNDMITREEFFYDGAFV
jgi:molybdopterin-guanine dinucleotide biosynthesis protein A